MGLNPTGFNVLSFSQISLSLKHVPKGKRVLSKGRATSSSTKLVVETSHKTLDSPIPNTHGAAFFFMDAELGGQSGGSRHGCLTSGECSGKENPVVDMEVVQFSAQRSLERHPSMIRSDCEIGTSDAHRSSEKSESDSLGSKSCFEDGDGVINNSGITVPNSTDSNMMHHESMIEVVGEKGARDSAEFSMGALAQVRDHFALCIRGDGGGDSALPPNSNASEGLGKVEMEEDKMDFDGRGDFTSAF